MHNFTEQDFEDGNPAKQYGISFLFSLILGYNLAAFLSDPGTNFAWVPPPGFWPDSEG